MRIEKILIGLESPKFYFEKGKEIYMSNVKGQMPKVALIASSDLPHCLRVDGPYGFHPDGPKFDKALIDVLKKKILKQF